METELKQKAELPGPGQYVTEAQSHGKEAARSSAVFKSALTRNQSVGADPRALVPGPGAYDPGSGLKVGKKPQHLQFFGSTLSRFDEQK